MTATLVLKDVARHFGGVPAVDGVSLQVPAGQITGLIGPNGAGKTTVVNLITGLLHLTSGQVLLDGKDVSREEAPDLARAGVARTFQNIRLVPDATCWTTCRRLPPPREGRPVGQPAGPAVGARRGEALETSGDGTAGALRHDGAGRAPCRRPVVRPPAPHRDDAGAGHATPSCCCSTSRWPA
jgi:ABC-type phosphonate transport system ATPase subunit